MNKTYPGSLQVTPTFIDRHEWRLACWNEEIKEHLFQKMLFSIPGTILAKWCLSLKSRGDLETARTGLAHRLFQLFCNALFWCITSVWNVKKIIFWNISHNWHAGVKCNSGFDVFFIRSDYHIFLNWYKMES